MKTTAVLLVGALLLAGCGQEEAPQAPLGHVEEIASPAADGSLTPHLYVGPQGQRLYLSWQERPDTARTALRYAVREEGGWSAPRTIAEGEGWFVNWADFPSLVVLEDGLLVAHALVKSGAEPYAYDVHLFRSTDDGKTWSDALVPHHDGTPTEHGFVSLVPGAGRAGIVWLDGRRFAEGRKEMTLRYAALGAEGQPEGAVQLDSLACDCCQTAATRTPHGLVVAYRDRSPEEVRDIAVVRLRDRQWTPPQPVHRDGWEIAGCPVNGPAIDSRERQVAVAWFTAASQAPRVKVAFSGDQGATFGAPARVDDGQPVGRVDVVLLEDGAALVSWMERTQDGAVLRIRRVSPEGERGQAVTVAPMQAGRANGFPQMALYRDSVYVAWTEPGEPSRVRTAAAPLSAL